jgi:hypothetical protein
MADLYASTSPASLSAGSQYAAEFNERLKSDIPLIDAVRWWYSAVGGPDVVNIDTLEMDMELSPAETAAFSLCLYSDWEASYEAPLVTDEYAFSAREQQDFWTKLKQARAALRVQ